jgi:DNA (cytosine-5)-methyltransferase 1
MNPLAVSSHLANMPHSEWIHTLTGETHIKDGDITKIPDATFAKYRGKVDVLFAGFPCQGFSVQGPRNDKDPRNLLAFQFVRIARLVQPRWIIGENVPRLLNVMGTNRRGNEQLMIQLLNDQFHSAGYRLSWGIVHATAAGVPQNRRRLVMVGSKHVFHIPLQTLAIPHTVPVRPCLRPHLHGAIPLPNRWLHDAPASTWIAAKGNASGKPSSLLTKLVKQRRLTVGSRSGDGMNGEILDPEKPAKVVAATYYWKPRMFVGLVDSTGQRWVRPLDPVELATIQGFPADWTFVGSERERIRQIGNAVPPPLVTAIVQAILPHHRSFVAMIR